jgi:hypothetical protein
MRGEDMDRPYLCNSPAQVLRRLVFDYLRYGYCRVAVFEIPQKKGADGDRIDRKVIEDYAITYYRKARMLQRRKGNASIVHLRYQRWIVLLATDGKHPQEGRVDWHDLREKPLTLFGYAVKVTPDAKPHVTVAQRKWARIRQVAHGLALHNEAKVDYFFRHWLERAVAFNHPMVMRQKMKLRNEINLRRGRAGLPKINKPLPTVTRWVNHRRHIPVGRAIESDA